MIRRYALRVCLFACIALPALAVVGAGVEAQEHYGWERSWRCARCGQYLGNGVQRPTYCHHCESKKNSTSAKSDSKGGPSPAAIALMGLGALAVVGLIVFWMGGSGREVTRGAR